MKRRSGGFDKGIVLLVLIALVAVSTTVFLFLQLRTDKITEDIRDGKSISIAFLIANEGELLFTELLLYHPATGRAAIFEIPGEWGAVIPSIRRIDRISVLYSHGQPEPFIEILEGLLATEIKYYIELDLAGLESLVHVLGGIEVFIANPVERVIEGTLVMLPSGSVVLDGAKAELFVSYQDPEETEVETRGRNQKFVQAVLRRLSERTDYVLDDKVLDFVLGSMNTNLNRRATEALVREFRGLNVDHIVSKFVPGARTLVDDQVLLFPHFEGQHVRESVRQTLQSLANTEVVGFDELNVMLEILNGTPQNGLAARTKQLYESFGYDVRAVGNAERNDHEKTRVIARTGDLSAAQRIADIIQCSEVVMASEASDFARTGAWSDNVDVTIILGSDFDGRYCK